MRVAFNMAPMNERALSLPLSEIDLFIVNETEGAALTGESDAERILDAVASTCPQCPSGPHPWRSGRLVPIPIGSLLCTGCKLPCSTRPARRYLYRLFLAGLLAMDAPVEALHRACLAAAISVERAGAATSIESS